MNDNHLRNIIKKLYVEINGVKKVVQLVKRNQIHLHVPIQH